ncbi:MAG: hydrolase [Ruminococcus sp.]|jgi:nicotinamidase-related amidase|nr:hydrolase [Ruminococcus sp.]
MEKTNKLINAPEVCVCIIDEQPQMFFGVQSTDRQTIMNNVVGLAKAAKVFNIPIVLSTVESKSFSGYIYSKLQDVFPIYAPIERTTLNSWEDKNFKQAVEKTGKKKLVIAGLWTEVCVTLPTISALAEGYEVIIVTDASGGATKEAHDMAILRMVQAGAIPVTWQALMLEWQRDWARKETYNAVTAVIKDHGGAYGMGIEYATTMLPPSAASS